VTQHPKQVTGTLYGSYICLFVTLWIATCALIAAAAALRYLPWSSLIGMTLGLIVLSVVMQRMNRLTVTSDGCQLNLAGQRFYIQWDNVSGIKEGLLGASLTFRTPQRMGLRSRKKFSFAALDPFWNTRATSTAVLKEVARSQRDGTDGH
jgi:hypothetical protein